MTPAAQALRASVALLARLLLASGSARLRQRRLPSALWHHRLRRRPAGAMAQVDVAPIPGRVGQRIRNELIFQSTGGGDALPPSHRLEVAITESVTVDAGQVDGDVARARSMPAGHLQADLVKDKQVVFPGGSQGRAGFERFQSIYSNVRAREDAENRAARTVAEEIKRRLASYLSSAA